MAEVYIIEDGNALGEHRSIRGNLRVFLFSVDDSYANAQLCFQPFPNNEKREAGLMVSVEEFKEHIKSTHSYDNVLTALIRLNRDGEKVTEKLEMLPGEADILGRMKHCRDDAIAYAKLFRELADHLDKEIPFFNAWISQEEQERKVEYPHYMKPPEDDDE